MNASLFSLSSLSSVRVASVLAAVGMVSLVSLRSAHAESLCATANIGQPCVIGESFEQASSDINADAGSDASAFDGDAGSDTEGNAGTVGTCVAASTTVSEADGGEVSASSYGVCILLPAEYCGPDETNQVCNSVGNTCQSLSVLAPSADGTTATTYNYSLCNGDANGNSEIGLYGDDPDDEGDTGGIGCSVARPSTMSESTNVLALVAGVGLVVSRRRKRSIFSSKKG